MKKDQKHGNWNVRVQHTPIKHSKKKNRMWERQYLRKIIAENR